MYVIGHCIHIVPLICTVQDTDRSNEDFQSSPSKHCCIRITPSNAYVVCAIVRLLSARRISARFLQALARRSFLKFAGGVIAVIAAGRTRALLAMVSPLPLLSTTL